MNATTMQEVSPVVTSSVDYAQTQVANEVNLAASHDKLDAIQGERIQKLMAKESELIDRIAALSELPDAYERERVEATLNADLNMVRAERIKYQEDVGVLASELFAIYDELGMQTSQARADAPADKAKREAASDLVSRAMRTEAEAKATVTAAETALTAAKDAWFFKGSKTETANTNLAAAKQAVVDAEAAVKVAQAGVTEAEAQIEIDKRDRVRKASLGENFALIRLFTSNALDALKKDSDATAVRINMTEQALTSALNKKRVTARELDEVRDQITTMDRDRNREQTALDEIPDQSSPEYAEQESVVANLKNELSKLKGKELSLNTTHMSMTQAAVANESSLLGLRIQHETTSVYIIKLTTAEKTAEILGRNIDQMVRNTQQEVATDNLDRVTDKMTMTAVELGVRAEIASKRNQNDAIERHDKLMKQLTKTRETGDQGVAVEAQRYLELDATIRAGYAERGVDLNMGHLEAAMKAVAGKAVPDTGGNVVY